MPCLHMHQGGVHAIYGRCAVVVSWHWQPMSHRLDQCSISSYREALVSQAKETQIDREDGWRRTEADGGGRRRTADVEQKIRTPHSDMWGMIASAPVNNVCSWVLCFQTNGQQNRNKVIAQRSWRALETAEGCFRTWCAVINSILGGLFNRNSPWFSCLNGWRHW